MRVIPVLIVATLVLLPGKARGQASPEYMAAYQAGINAYNLGQYQAAKKNLQRAAAIDDTLPGAFRYLALVAKAQESWDECLAHATQAVVLNPVSKFAPVVRQIHADCRKELGRPAFLGVLGNAAAIGVTANISGATVTLNGLKYGATPLDPREFAAGPVSVTVSRQGYLEQTKKVVLVSGLVTDVSFDLQVDPKAVVARRDEPPAEVNHGWVVITTEPQNAVVSIDGKPAKYDDKRRIVDSPGLHVVIVEAPGFEAWKRRVRVSRGQVLRYNIVLRSSAARYAERRKGMLALGAALGFTGVGVFFGLRERSRFEEAQDLWDIEVHRPTSVSLAESARLFPVRTREDLAEIRDEGKKFALISNVAYAGALASLAASIYYFMNERPPEREGIPLPIALRPLLPNGSAFSGVGATLSYRKELP